MRWKSIFALAAIALMGLVAFSLTLKNKVKASPKEDTNGEELLLLQTPRKVGIGQIVRPKALLLRQDGRPIQAQPVIFSANGGNFISGTFAYTNNWGEFTLIGRLL